MRAKQPWNIFEEAIGWLEGLGNLDDLEEESRSFPGKSRSPPGDGQILAWETSDEEINRVEPVVLPLPHVSCAGNVWPPSGKDSTREGITLNLPCDFTANPF
jgi:hypothetical protein